LIVIIAHQPRRALRQTATTGVEVTMDNSVQLGWIAEAEARSICEIARLQQSELPPFDGSLRPRLAGGCWLQWLRRLVPHLVWDLATEVDPQRVLVTVLITDIVDSTRLVAKIGDQHWRALLDRHDDAVRRQIRRFGGREIDNRGDGFLVTFESPARAVRCAAAIAEATAPLGISVRCGVHVGEIHHKRNEISGIAVHIAARIAATARPGEAFVSKTVRDLVTGSGLAFEDRGLHQLRGLPEEIHLYAMRALC
jgi:class 3 adenylate cyclase